ncbi:ACP5 [Symbiodinium sp. CCMP2592]|nr:ACP5 [Symbiodinium sp. CCMP2592]
MAGASFSFFALADFGVDIHYFIPSMSRHFLQSALAMKHLAQSPEVDIRFVALLGDNAYPMGVSGTDDVVWRGIFEDVFQFGRGLKWYAVLGNHDYWNVASAQVAYTYRHGYLSEEAGRWYMPAHWYSEVVEHKGISICMLALDTEQANGMSHHSEEGNDIFPYFRKQRAWFEREVSKPVCQQAHWIVVLGHHCVISAGPRGSIPHMQPFLDVMVTWHVDLFLCGHDHVSQHAQHMGIHVLAAGAVSLSGARGDVDDPRVDFFHEQSPVFAMFTVSHEAIQGGFRSGSNASWLFRYKQGSGQREARLRTVNTSLW